MGTDLLCSFMPWPNPYRYQRRENTATQVPWKLVEDTGVKSYKLDSQRTNKKYK